MLGRCGEPGSEKVRQLIPLLGELVWPTGVVLDDCDRRVDHWFSVRRDFEPADRASKPAATSPGVPSAIAALEPRESFSDFGSGGCDRAGRFRHRDAVKVRRLVVQWRARAITRSLRDPVMRSRSDCVTA